MDKKNILITESQLEDLLKSIIDMITGKKSASSGGFDLLSLLGLKKGTTSSFGRTSSFDTNYRNMVQKIIDNFEGGYYHPDMKLSGMGKSGETMYGIDRKWGGESNTSKGLEFWSLIDKDRAKNPDCYKYEYDPANGKGKCYNPTLANQLKDLIADMMKPQYDDLSKRYLSDEARDIVNKTPELLFNFTYCVWNGSGYFQKFSNVLNQKIKSGIKDPQELAKIMVDYRKNFSEYSSFANRLTQRGGNNMGKVLGIS